MNRTTLQEERVNEGTYGKDIREPIHDALKILYDSKDDLIYKMRVSQSTYDNMQHSDSIIYIVAKE